MVAAAANSTAMIGRRKERFVIETTSIRSHVLPYSFSVGRPRYGSRHDVVAEMNHQLAAEIDEKSCRVQVRAGGVPAWHGRYSDTVQYGLQYKKTSTVSD
ncbi:hypothetical protein [Amycolatopsis alkalitolerans]|uniref:hypothetical protein n=1 Tax=Amycolatopsis alkalitolerans TaxID=2547244 RepID=UPI001359EB10|nr:hypothetical protein [Amycolatopsis alkalitolerans]